jgi:hypothetical protein
MLGRRLTTKGWLQLGALGVAVLTLLFLICAPLATVSIRLDLPPASAARHPITSSQWIGLAEVLGFLLASIGVPILIIWLVIRTALRIVRAQPKSDA